MHPPGTSTLAAARTIEPKEHQLTPKLNVDEGHITIPAVSIGDDRLALRAKSLATIRRNPVSNAKERNEALSVGKAGTKDCTRYTPEQASRVRLKNVSKKAWPKYDPSLEEEMDSDDEYYAARIRTIRKAKDMYGKGSGGTPSSKSVRRSDGSPTGFSMQSSSATSLSSKEEEIKLGDHIADLAIALPPSASLHSARAICNPSISDEEVVFAGRGNITPPLQPVNYDNELSTSIEIGGRFHPQPGQLKKQVVSCGMDSKPRPLGSYNKETSGIKSGFAHRLVERFTRLNVSDQEEFARRQTAKQVGHEADSEVHGKRKSKAFGF